MKNIEANAITVERNPRLITKIEPNLLQRFLNEKILTLDISEMSRDDWNEATPGFFFSATYYRLFTILRNR